MRVNPMYVTDLASSLDQTQATEQQLTTELSSGTKLTSLGQDPAAAGENTLLSSEISRNDSFSQTESSSTSMLQMADSALGGVVTQLTSAVSLATEANNGTLNAGNLQSIAEQLSGIRDQVLSLANTTYLGQYVFSGSKGSSPAYTLDTSSSPAVAAYNGDNAVNYVQTPGGQQIQVSVPGSQIFSAAGNDVLGTLNQLIADFSSGTPSASANADAQQLNQVLGYVNQQRVVIDNSISRLSAVAQYTQSESVQLQSAQSTLVQADVAQVSTQLSTAETQQAALTQVIATLGKNSLFNYL